MKKLPSKTAAVAERKYKDVWLVYEAMQHIINAFCQCALANGYSSGAWGGKTSDGMEWNGL